MRKENTSKIMKLFLDFETVRTVRATEVDSRRFLS